MRFTIDDEEAFYAREKELVNDFIYWLEGDLGSGADDLELLLDWKWGYGDGRLDSWSAEELSEFLLGWCPRKLSAPADQVADLPINVGFSMRFLADRGLLSPGNTPGADLAAYAIGLREEFVAQMGDATNFGMGKAIFASTGIEDPETLTPELLEQVMADFNALPEESRRAITDSAMATSASAESGPRPLDLAPVQLPEPSAAADAAERAPLLAGFDALGDYFAAPGQSLTKTGAIKIADAQALVEILQTADRYEHTIGEHVFRKQSAREFVDVDLWLWWAREVGVLRAYRGKLVAVKSWHRRRRSDAIGELTKALDKLLATGPIAARNPRLYLACNQALDQSAQGLLITLLDRHEREFDDLVAGATSILAAQGVAIPYPNAVEDSVDTMLRLFERCGVLVQFNTRSEPDTFEGRRVGGSVQLTPAGVSMIIDVLNQQGLSVDTLPAFGEQSVAGLLELSMTVSNLEQWWGLASTWLDKQPDAPAAVCEVLAELAARDLTPVILILDAAPAAEEHRLAPALREIASDRTSADDPLKLVARSWLTVHEPFDADQIEKVDHAIPRLLSLGALCAAGAEEFVATTVAEEFEPSAQLQLVADAGRLLPPLTTELLAALGERHPDKRLAKAARKELFRVRTKLATGS